MTNREALEKLKSINITNNLRKNVLDLINMIEPLVLDNKFPTKDILFDIFYSNQDHYTIEIQVYFENLYLEVKIKEEVDSSLSVNLLELDNSLSVNLFIEYGEFYLGEEIDTTIHFAKGAILMLNAIKLSKNLYKDSKD